MARSSPLEVSNSAHSPMAEKSNFKKSSEGSQQGNGSATDGGRGLEQVGGTHKQGKRGGGGGGGVNQKDSQRGTPTHSYTPARSAAATPTLPTTHTKPLRPPDTPCSLRLDLANISKGPGGGGGVGGEATEAGGFSSSESVRPGEGAAAPSRWESAGVGGRGGDASPRSSEVTPRSLPPANARASAARRSVTVKATSKPNQNTGWVSPRSIPTNANIGNLFVKPSPRAMPSPRTAGTTTASPRTPRAGLPSHGSINTPSRVPAPIGVWR